MFLRMSSDSSPTSGDPPGASERFALASKVVIPALSLVLALVVVLAQCSTARSGEDNQREMARNSFNREKTHETATSLFASIQTLYDLTEVVGTTMDGEIAASGGFRRINDSFTTGMRDLTRASSAARLYFPNSVIVDLTHLNYYFSEMAGIMARLANSERVGSAGAIDRIRRDQYDFRRNWVMPDAYPHLRPAEIPLRETPGCTLLRLTQNIRAHLGTKDGDTGRTFTTTPPSAPSQQGVAVSSPSSTPEPADPCW